MPWIGKSGILTKTLQDARIALQIKQIEKRNIRKEIEKRERSFLIKNLKVFLLLVFSLAILSTACVEGEIIQNVDDDSSKDLLLATTTSTYDSELLSFILPFFEAEYGYEVKVSSLGTGACLELGKAGDCDLVLVHARDLELEMLEDEYYTDREDVMYNDFVIVGPEDDELDIENLENVEEVLEKIYQMQKVFVSRGDKSGTHIKELSLWEYAGINPKGHWYKSAGSGMGDTLLMVDEFLGYTLTDRGTFLSMRDMLDLVILFEGDENLLNQYGIMAVNKELHTHVNYKGAKDLIEFFVSPRGQNLIDEYKVNGEQLFFANTDNY